MQTTSNAAIENLELLTRAELMNRNSIHRYPRALKFAIRVAAKVKRRKGGSMSTNNIDRGLTSGNRTNTGTPEDLT